MLRSTLLTLVLLPCSLLAADSSFTIPPLATTVNLDGQRIAVAVAGTAHTVPSAGARDAALHIDLTVDLADLNAHLTELLSPRVNRNERCGQRLELRRATLRALPNGAMLAADAQVESYACAKAFGKQITTRLTGGEARIEVKLTPRVEQQQTLRLDGHVTSIDATGSLGQLLRSEPFGDVLRDKLADAVAHALQRSLAHLQAQLPPAARDLATLDAVRFLTLDGDRFALAVSGDLHVDATMARALIDKLGETTPKR